MAEDVHSAGADGRDRKNGDFGAAEGLEDAGGSNNRSPSCKIVFQELKPEFPSHLSAAVNGRSFTIVS
jgi:hypothetical protein